METKLFGKWDAQGIKAKDPGLIGFITVQPVYMPRSGARYAKNKFYKSKTHIVERLMNKLMTAGHKGKKHKTTSYHISGKASKSYSIVYDALMLIEKQTKTNPVEVLVRAVEHAAPREEIVSIEYGGARYPKAVECAPQRRVDIALRYMVQGAYQKSFNAKRTAADTLAEEVINASKSNSASNAISRKLEIERQADTSR